MGEIKKIKTLIVLNGLYALIGMIMCLYFLNLTHFRGKGRNPYNNFVVVFGKFKTQKFLSDNI